MEGGHPLKGKFKFRDLPFEKVIKTMYKLQVKTYESVEDEFFWDTVSKGEYEYVYEQYKKYWTDRECRMLQIETSVWEISDDTRTE